MSSKEALQQELERAERSAELTKMAANLALDDVIGFQNKGAEAQRVASKRAIVARHAADAVEEVKAKLAVHDAPEHYTPSEMLANAAGAHEVAATPVAWIDEEAFGGKVGPWLAVIEYKGEWAQPNIFNHWAKIQQFCRRVDRETGDKEQVVTFPVRWIKTLPVMLLELDTCRRLIRKEACNILCNRGITEQLRRIASSLDAVIAMASPPKTEEAEG